MSASEFMAQLEQDQGYQLRKETFDSQLQERADELRSAEVPIVADLREAGLDVASVWDLVNTSEPYPAALPVLLAHLERGGYPDRVMESLGRAIAVAPAEFAWHKLRGLYLRSSGRGEEEGLAVALAAAATPEHLEELIALTGEASRGDSRIHLLRAIKRVGGQPGIDFLLELTDDQLFGKEAAALLGNRS